MTVRCKFRCILADRESGRLKFEAVTGGSPDNDSFFKYTPAGALDVQTINESAIAEFEVGKEYFIDISAA